MRHRQVYDATSAEFASFAEECASVARALGIFAIARAKFTREYGAFAEECAAFAEEDGAFTKACALFTWECGAFTEACGAYARVRGSFALAENPYRGERGQCAHGTVRCVQGGGARVPDTGIECGGVIVLQRPSPMLSPDLSRNLERCRTHRV